MRGRHCKARRGGRRGTVAGLVRAPCTGRGGSGSSAAQRRAAGRGQAWRRRRGPSHLLAGSARCASSRCGIRHAALQPDVEEIARPQHRAAAAAVWGAPLRRSAGICGGGRAPAPEPAPGRPSAKVSAGAMRGARCTADPGMGQEMNTPASGQADAGRQADRPTGRQVGRHGGRGGGGRGRRPCCVGRVDFIR